MQHSLKFQGIEEQRLFQVANRQSKIWNISKNKEMRRYCSVSISLLTCDEKFWGFVNTTIPPNNVIKCITKVMSFKKSICGSMIEIGSKICWFLGPKHFLKNEHTLEKIKDFRICHVWCILRYSILDFAENSFYSQFLSTSPLWYIILIKDGQIFYNEMEKWIFVIITFNFASLFPFIPLQS